MKYNIIFALGFALTVFCNATALGRTFEAEGVDNGMGVGPRYMAMGGAAAAASNDVYAAYFNPAGLAEVKGPEVSVSRQLNATLHDINFLGVALPLPMPKSLGLDVTIAGVYYPRIHARASGAFDKTDFESNFLRFLLPGIAGTFNGDIDTKTKTYRFSVGIAAADNSTWSLGFYLDRVSCTVSFCGVQAKSKGYTYATVKAGAYGAGFGARYRLNTDWTFSAAISDLDTKLKVNYVITDDAGTKADKFYAYVPRKILVGAVYNAFEGAIIAVDYDITKGKYGSSLVELQFLRTGFEKTIDAWSYRAGFVLPLSVRSSVTDSKKNLYLAAPTFGLGWSSGGIQIDVVLYAHPTMSISKHKPSPAADMALSWRY